MQGEVNERDLDVEVLREFFNTPGTEITPRSHVVGEDLQNDRFGHLSDPKLGVKLGVS